MLIPPQGRALDGAYLPVLDACIISDEFPIDESPSLNDQFHPIIQFFLAVYFPLGVPSEYISPWNLKTLDLLSVRYLGLIPAFRNSTEELLRVPVPFDSALGEVVDRDIPASRTISTVLSDIDEGWYRTLIFPPLSPVKGSGH